MMLRNGTAEPGTKVEDSFHPSAEPLSVQRVRSGSAGVGALILTALIGAGELHGQTRSRPFGATR